MSANEYLTRLFLLLTTGAILVLLVVVVIDPYGALRTSFLVEGFNKAKPFRLRIERMTEPWEIWRDQPKTIFIGSSRVFQGFDLGALHDSDLLPAYNSGLPGADIAYYLGSIRQYIALDKHLKTIYLEVFMERCFDSNDSLIARPWSGFYRDTASLFFSADALFAAMGTVEFNRKYSADVPYDHIDEWGRHVFSRQQIDPQWYFNMHVKDLGRYWLDPSLDHRGLSFQLRDTAFSCLDQIVAACRQNGVAIYFILPPFHEIQYYEYEAFGHWKTVTEFMERMAHYHNVLYFRQSSYFTQEPISSHMIYWFDPQHFTPLVGEMLLKAIQGISDSNAPSDLLIPLDANNVMPVLEQLRTGVNLWRAENPEIVRQIEGNKQPIGQ